MLARVPRGAGEALTSLIIGFLVVCLAGLPAAARDLAAARAAMDAVTDDRWAEAYAHARRSGDPLVGKLVFFYDTIRRTSEQTFSAVAAFMAANPHWPEPDRLQAQAERAMPPGLPPARVIAWFGGRPPVTGVGGVRLAEALKRNGDSAGARAALRRAWQDGRFSAAEEAAILADFAGYLTDDDHVRRLDRLLWEGRTSEAERMRARVDAGWRALADARIRLRRQSAGVDAAISAVPASLQSHPGLVYERVRWRRKKDRDAEARALLAAHSDAAEPDRWWTERSILARRALADGLTREAYRIASGHRMTGGSEFAEAEFVAGWIALRFLNEPGKAAGHFQRLYDSVSYPISLARGAYWRGRAAEAMGESATATGWYRNAAAHSSTFYGQLAGLRLNPGQPMTLPAAAAPTAAQTAAFERHELTGAVRLLAAVDQDHRLYTFILHLAGLDDAPGWKRLTGDLAVSLGRPDLGVFVAKDAYKTGNILVNLGYPELTASPLPGGARVERALALAVIRQESAFRMDAVSRAGARGLMQLMPATAQRVSRQNGLPYAPHRLTSDPAYNMALGQAYLADMLARFGGSKVLALCAYNAGPGRADRWRREHGDPHASLEQAIDWIERIPFSETRNYVQRVLENLQVYRAKMAGGATARTLTDDLLRRP